MKWKDLSAYARRRWLTVRFLANQPVLRFSKILAETPAKSIARSRGGRECHAPLSRGARVTGTPFSI